MANITVAIPNQGSVAIRVLMSVLNMLKSPSGHAVMFDCQTREPIVSCRNTLVKRFLAGDSDYLLFIDSDNPPIKNPLDLVDLDKDIMIYPTLIADSTKCKLGGMRVKLKWNIWGGWLDDKQVWDRYKGNMSGLEEVGAGGSGCMLVARRVLEKIKPAFSNTWDEDGISKTGEDLGFCKRAKEEGFKVWAHWGYVCHHFKTVELTEILNLVNTLGDEE